MYNYYDFSTWLQRSSMIYCVFKKEKVEEITKKTYYCTRVLPCCIEPRVRNPNVQRKLLRYSHNNQFKLQSLNDDYEKNRIIGHVRGPFSNTLPPSLIQSQATTICSVILAPTRPPCPISALCPPYYAFLSQ